MPAIVMTLIGTQILMATEGRKKMKISYWLTITMFAAWVGGSLADSVEARCDIYPAGEDHTDVSIPCRFSQRQGAITIIRSDGVTHQLSPAEALGHYRDEEGHAVYRQSGLGDQGLIFRFPAESVYVYWDNSSLQPQDPDNPTAPFSTADYDATTLLPCKPAGATEFSQCPAGILRMENNQASIEVRNPSGEQFTINFLTDVSNQTNYVNATNRELNARLEGDTWILEFANGEVWQVPLAAIEGG